MDCAGEKEQYRHSKDAKDNSDQTRITGIAIRLFVKNDLCNATECAQKTSPEHSACIGFGSVRPSFGALTG